MRWRSHRGLVCFRRGDSRPVVLDQPVRLIRVSGETSADRLLCRGLLEYPHYTSLGLRGMRVRGRLGTIRPSPAGRSRARRTRERRPDLAGATLSKLEPDAPAELDAEEAGIPMGDRKDGRDSAGPDLSERRERVIIVRDIVPRWSVGPMPQGRHMQRFRRSREGPRRIFAFKPGDTVKFSEGRGRRRANCRLSKGLHPERGTGLAQSRWKVTYGSA